MPERFIQANVLPPEVADRIQRKLRGAYAGVQDDPQQIATVTVRFTIRANEIGDADGEYTIEQKFADRCTSETGKIRDGQLVLPGTGLRSDESPMAWEDRMLAAPGRGR